MKRVAGLIATAALGLGFAPASWSIAVNGTDVGSVDTLLGQAELANSGPAELAFIQGLLPGQILDFGSQIQNVTYQATDTADIFAFELNPVGDYFLIKNSTWTALFQNLAQFDWAVFDSTLLNAGFNIGSDSLTISHIRVVNGTPDEELPEPTTLGMLGLGLVGLGVMRRRRQAR